MIAIMKIRGKRWAFVALVAITVPLLAGCTASSMNATPSPTKSPSTAPTKTPATPSPAPSTEAAPVPSDSASGAGEVVVTAAAIEVRDVNGDLVASYDYFQPTSDVVAGLTTAFGREATASRKAGGNHTPPSTLHEWGGFQLVDTDTPGSPPYSSNHWVIVSSAAENGVDIRTVGGIAVGDNAAALEAAHAETSDRLTVTGLPERLDIYVGQVPLPEMTPGSGEALTFSVWLIAPDPAGAITEFRAPSPNFGA